jgi:hypothetical protein
LFSSARAQRTHVFQERSSEKAGVDEIFSSSGVLALPAL